MSQELSDSTTHRPSILRWRSIPLTLLCLGLAFPGWSQEGTELTATVFPFVDSKGRVYATSPDGLLELLELVEAVDLGGEAGSSSDFERENPDAVELLGKALETDVYIGGSVFRLEDEPILAVTAAWSDTGEVITRIELGLDPANVPDVFWELPEAPPEQDLAVTVEGLFGAYSAGGLRQQVLLFGPDEDVREERSFWGKVRDTLGGGFRGSGHKPEKFPPFGGDDEDDYPAPGDGYPPNLFGEELGEDQLCRIQLQCKWSLSTRYYSASLGFLTRSYHCGWYTFIQSADPPRLGFHVQPAPVNEKGDRGKVDALVFQGDLGFQELEPTYKFFPFDSQRDGLDKVCERAACIRRASWDYNLLGYRQYRPFGQGRPNSNSFHGAVRRECIPPAPRLPAYPEEGRYPGMHYWQRVEPQGRHWRTHEW